MDRQFTILVLGRNPDIMQVILRLINGEPDLKAIGALTDEDAQAALAEQTFDLVLIGGGVEESSEREIKQIIDISAVPTKMVRHYGGGSGLLFNEIRQALQ
jgi:hypothetical protein